MATDFGRLPFELLDVDNYATWQTRMMKFLLITRGLWIAVTSNGEVDPDTDQKALALIGTTGAQAARPATTAAGWATSCATAARKSETRRPTALGLPRCTAPSRSEQPAGPSTRLQRWECTAVDGG